MTAPLNEKGFHFVLINITLYARANTLTHIFEQTQKENVGKTTCMRETGDVPNILNDNKEKI